jgi:DNA-directed RNA polymerase specialized sigma subunit
MTETKSKRPTYSDEQKADVRRRLEAKETYETIFKATGVGTGTISNIAKDMKGGSTKTAKVYSNDTSESAQLRALLEATRTRKKEVEDLIAKDTLAKELEQLTAREKQYIELINSYA